MGYLIPVWVLAIVRQAIIGSLSSFIFILIMAFYSLVRI